MENKYTPDFVTYPETHDEIKTNIYFKIISQIYGKTHSIFEYYKRKDKEHEHNIDHNKWVIIIFSIFIISVSVVTGAWITLAVTVLGMFISIPELRYTTSTFEEREKELKEIIQFEHEDIYFSELENEINFLRENNFSKEEILERISDFYQLYYILKRNIELGRKDLTIEKLEKSKVFNNFENVRCNCCNKTNVPVKYFSYENAFICIECYNKYFK